MEKNEIVQTAQAKTDTLEKLCRALQTERTKLLSELKQFRGSNDAEEMVNVTFMMKIHKIKWIKN